MTTTALKVEVLAVSLSKTEVWALVHAERRRLLEDLTTLRDEHWNTPSLCRNWTVHDVLAHIVDTAKTGKLAFIWSMLRACGDFDRANERGVQRCKRGNPRDTLADFRRALTLRRIPTAHRATRLVEAIVHGEDIRRPLGIASSYPSVAVHEAIAYQLRTPAAIGGSREQAAGCRLVDVDTGESWGEGMEVSGKAIDLLLALTGRNLAPRLLSGPGAQRLLKIAADTPERSRDT
ncbi:maleylpyruvate isomerase family mycothiol-dependent enzyme [Buchananella hordeovulneris]|uniref:maleylpyruvate isomerase family mycothiol-dependent enzyme n=1 Tax=Buchananella hordeovulneris TaxID=52770 RepID=UPI0026DC3861|nr:maleylpyruvate isomerase family mycothiol-dependent enzyme [Buchananella hordeovulneris]MDO5080047.1 maleylpyruvate isomerase family mycothiol-dependent enzyme [Buchananella hordeovulneris]